MPSPKSCNNSYWLDLIPNVYTKAKWDCSEEDPTIKIIYLRFMAEDEVGLPCCCVPSTSLRFFQVQIYHLFYMYLVHYLFMCIIIFVRTKFVCFNHFCCIVSFYRVTLLASIGQYISFLLYFFFICILLYLSVLIMSSARFVDRDLPV